MYLKYRQKLIIGLTILAAILIVSSAYVYIEFFEKEEEPVEEEIIEYEPDDRISPLENQGLILEIKRIRHRGILDKLIKPLSTSWRNKPSFYFISDMDGLVYVSKDVQGPGFTAEYLFNTWDTMPEENKVMKHVEEEQEASEVKITIVERVKEGLLGLRSKDIEREVIRVIYDYRTGRWSGADSFMDHDGYGHYVGEYFEVWFNLYQTDYDGDGIPYWTEVNVLHTDPKVDDSKRDPDGDGIPTSWEWKWGYDPHVWDDHVNLDPDIDGIENIEEYQMEKWFADPFTQDIYIELDGMERGGLFDHPHYMTEEAQQAVIERFSRHNIKLFIDNGWPDTPKNGGGEVLPYYDSISQDSGMMLQFYQHNFPDERKGIFRYVVFGHTGAFTHPSKFNRYDTTLIGYNRWQWIRPLQYPIHVPTERAWCIHQGAGFMHEIGHTLGITPWTIEGCDNISFMYGLKALKQYRNTWTNYYSVMNYYWVVFFDWFKTLLDYSDGSNGPPYDQNDWEHIYLPYFQISSECVEDPTAAPPCHDIVTHELEAAERLEFGLNDWKYDENLTQQFIKGPSGFSPIDPIEIDYRVYVKTDDASGSSENEMNLRVYGLAKVYPTISEYLLVKEGYVDSEGNIQIYSQQDLIDDIMSELSQ